jgi:hypothetical protein
MIAEIVRNKDYYGVKIRNEDDPLIQQLKDVGYYSIRGFEPFWIRGAGKEAERGGGWQKTLAESPQKLLAPEIGIMPATSAYTMSAFEKFARKATEEQRPMGTRTKEQAEKGKMKQGIESALRRGDAEAETLIADAIVADKITDAEVDQLRKKALQDPIEKVSRSLNIENLARGVPKMNTKEKEIARPIFEKKIENLHNSGRINDEEYNRYLNVLETMQ